MEIKESVAGNVEKINDAICLVDGKTRLSPETACREIRPSLVDKESCSTDPYWPSASRARSVSLTKTMASKDLTQEKKEPQDLSIHEQSCFIPKSEAIKEAESNQNPKTPKRNQNFYDHRKDACDTKVEQQAMNDLRESEPKATENEEETNDPIQGGSYEIINKRSAALHYVSAEKINGSTKTGTCALERITNPSSNLLPETTKITSRRKRDDADSDEEDSKLHLRKKQRSSKEEVLSNVCEGQPDYLLHHP